MRQFRPLLAAAALVLSAAAAHADLGDQLFKLLPDDGAADNRFGFSVAISGTTAVLGAYHDDDNGYYSGSAYLFSTTTGQQIAKLIPDDGEAEDWFGYSVGVSTATAIVGSAWDKGIASGSAYLFSTTTGQQIAQLLPDDGAGVDNFGFSVAIGGDVAIVGAPVDGDNGYWAGAAYLFDATTGQKLFKLLPDDAGGFEWFGYAVAISGMTAVIGASQDSDNGVFSGSAYLFDITTGAQIAKLLPNDGADSDRFGTSVAMNGTTAVVGAYWDQDNGFKSGSAYLFNTTTGQQIAKLLPDDGAERDEFGFSVAISGAAAIVGAHEDDDNGKRSGSVYVFDITTGQQLAKLLPDDGASFHQFGNSVAISGVTAIAGAPYDDDNGDLSGSAYLFDAGGAPSCPWDFDGDANVGPFDLAYLLNSWGPNSGHPADLNGDGEVGPPDLALVLGNWGLCE